MHIRILNPMVAPDWEADTLRQYTNAARPGVETSSSCLDWGPPSIESRFDEAMATPDIVAKVLQAQGEGVDAVVIDCMGDPGLFPAREMADIPVVAPGEASMHLASIVGHRFSVIAVLDVDVPVTIEMAGRYGLAAHLASVRPIYMSVMEIHADPDAAFQRLVDVAQSAVEHDDARVIVPGCGLFAHLVPTMATALAERGCGVPVVNPRAAAIKLAESLVDLGLSHSRRTFVRPEPKTIRWPAALIGGDKDRPAGTN